MTFCPVMSRSIIDPKENEIIFDQVDCDPGCEWYNKNSQHCIVNVLALATVGAIE